ncbi:hypothetical protein P4O66_000851 [Electrophorus voltai]|uniref:Reverse transcriptase/retrotransposon-derived protein RNase H-like domain-containing protein n=1 Tax=Electrophorus voltai TaxID=2609070 RepID=A0AAD8ZGC7_9TELE|nr:hypothetical protein P4O66_000851 [Electrophorus voltai]
MEHQATVQGYICSSTSPASAGVFFIKKKDRGLRPCVDYQGLNKLLVTYPCPLPLVPVALEQLRGAWYFTRPFMDLLWGKTKQLRWGEVAERTFADLKTAFSSAPLLQQPDPERPFIVEVDASDMRVGAVLSLVRGEEGKLGPIAYFSRKLSPSKQNHGVGDRELLVMKLTLEEWRHWLEGVRHPFTIITDHKMVIPGSSQRKQ